MSGGSRKPAPGSQRRPRPQRRGVARERAGFDADRERRALDYAAKRVPAWQVSVVGVLMRLDPPDGEDEQRRYFAALGQVPPPVLRAVEMHRTAAAHRDDGGPR